MDFTGHEGMKIRIDKRASVTINIQLGREVSCEPTCASGTPERGLVCVVKALEEKRVYDRIELVSGRMAKISKGDVIAGALGQRRALQGFAGIIPDSIREGDVLHVLNIGGVLGRAVSFNREFGPPLRVEYLGTVVDGGKPVNIRDNALPTVAALADAPRAGVVVVSGTSMNCGKTAVASKITQELTWRGCRVCSAKVSGIAALKDILNMQDHGAVESLSFLDFGYPSTVDTKDVPLIARGAITALSESEPDVLIIELGDGVLGDYGVAEFFREKELREIIGCNIVCALDPVGARGMVNFMEHEGLPVHLVSGPVTDNIVGTDFIERLNLRALNSVYQQEELGDYVWSVLNG